LSWWKQGVLEFGPVQDVRVEMVSHRSKGRGGEYLLANRVYGYGAKKTVGPKSAVRNFFWFSRKFRGCQELAMGTFLGASFLICSLIASIRRRGGWEEAVARLLVVGILGWGFGAACLGL